MKLSKQATLTQYQEYVKAMVLERGFDKETVSEVFTIMVEEVGELAKAIRKANGQKVASDSKHHDLEEEAADVFFILLDICNRLNIDLDQAFLAKEVKNNSRNW